MIRLRTRIFLYSLLLVVFICFSFLFSLLRFSGLIVNIENAAKVQKMILAVGLIIGLLAILLAWFISLSLSRGITRPVSQLIKASQAVSKKDFSQQINTPAISEIKPLILQFNQMSKQLKYFQDDARRHNRNLEKIVRDKTKELSYIYRIGREISSTLDLGQVLDTIVKRSAEVLDLKICSILLVEEELTVRLKVRSAQGINVKKIERQLIKRGEGISGWIWDKQEALLVKDLAHDQRFIGRKKEKYYTGTLISTPLEAEGKVIGVIIGNNKTNGHAFREEDLLLLKEIAIESAIAIDNALLYERLKEVYLHTISALAGALDAKDHYTRSHSENVTKYALAVASELGLPGPQVEVIRQACQLHDLGKIGIHDYILTKPGKLSIEEWEEIKLHSLRGAQILQPIGFLNNVVELVRQHHERYDGTGYPLNLSGEDIHLGARIMAVADAFDAMTSERPYRKALTFSQAVAELKSNSGTQFDPGLVKIFLKILEAKPHLIKEA
jgi:putative nucleotidyltransferase with HDIG domain